MATFITACLPGRYNEGAIFLLEKDLVYMPFTEKKLQAHLANYLRKAYSGERHPLSPVLVAPATGPMTPPPSPASEEWQPVEVGQLWGRKHATVWLKTELQVPEPMRNDPVILQLHWDSPSSDGLILRLEATAFLDGIAVGAFDYYHKELQLPPHAADGQPHEVTIQVYTSEPIPFRGLTIHNRNETAWKLYHVIETVLDAALALDENDIVRHTLIERLNAAYNMLDLREGYSSARFVASAKEAIAYLQEHLRDGLEDGNRPRVVVTGHAHLDLAWQWPYWRTRQKAVHTISTVLALMERYPDYHYSHSQPQSLQWVKEDAPEVFERVKQRVKEGRFELVGGMWVEPDCNLPSGESLVRQIMQGLRFLKEEFDYKPNNIWLPDVFGYSAALPQIMRGFDIPVFMTTKISWNQFNRMPNDTFRWRGIDGTEVLTHFVTAPVSDDGGWFYTYNGPFRARDMVGIWKNYRQQKINDEILYLCGWGDGGGGPDEHQMERAEAMKSLPGYPEVRWDRSEKFFRDLYERVWDDPRLPTWAGELYLEYHRGTYTSQGRTKLANRRNELLYRDAELLSTWAGLTGSQEELNKGWRGILLNQFHDVLPGSSITEVYEDATRIHAEARALGEKVRDEACSVLGERFGWRKGDLVLMNTLAWQRTDPVQIPAELQVNNLPAQQVEDWDGHKYYLVDGLQIPAVGAVLADQAASASSEVPCSISRTTDGLIALHNQYYDLTFAANGEISRIYDKVAERDVLVPGQNGNQLIAYEDRPMNYDAWDIDLYYEEKPYPLHEASEIRVIEEGPVRVTVEVIRPFMASTVKQRISLWRNSPRIDFSTEIDWHEHQTLLKAAFPVDINALQATYEIQFGNVQRPTHRNTSWDLARFEVCAHRWADLSEGGYGVSLLNDAKYGHDIHDNVMRLTLLKSGIVPDPTADQGIHRFTYSLLPHKGDWRDAEVVRRAYELNVPVLAVTGSTSTSSAEERVAAYSFMQTDCQHVVIDTVKPAEDGDGFIVRLYEAHNQRGKGSITFSAPIASAQECNLLEETIADASYQGNALQFQVRPFEIKTFRVKLEA